MDSIDQIPLLDRDQIRRELKRRLGIRSFALKGRKGERSVPFAAVYQFFGNGYIHVNLWRMAYENAEISDTWQLRLSQFFYLWDKGEIVYQNRKLVRVPPKEAQAPAAEIRPWVDLTGDVPKLRFD